jgi:hypothetical protein
MVKKKDKEHYKKQPATSETTFKHRNKLIAICVIAAIIAGLTYYLQHTNNTIDTQLPLVDGIPCETKEYLTFHIHAHLDVFVDGHAITVPALIGIPGTCLYWLHTHQTDGIIHIEAPQAQDFALSQFIDIWKSTSRTNSAIPAPSSGNPIIYINGQVVSTTLDNTKLNSHDEIVLVYGNPPPNIRSFYQFPEGL